MTLYITWFNNFIASTTVTQLVSMWAEPRISQRWHPPVN